MKMTIESTTKIVELNGIPCRVWEGETAKGVKVHAFVPRVAVREGDDASEFEADLKEQRKPSADVAAIPLRMVL